MTTVHPDLEQVVQQRLEAVLDAIPPASFGEEMAAHLKELVPELARPGDEDFRTGLVLSCVSNLTAIWEQLLRGAPVDQATPPADAVAWSHELVHRGVRLPALLRAYRLGHAFAEARVETVASRLDVEPELRWRVLAQTSRHFFAYIDAICTQLVEDYEQERARWIRGAAAARAELAHSIIERRIVDLRAATERLRYDVAGRHLAMIVWADPKDATERGGSLEAEATNLAGALGGSSVLTVPIGERVVWAWTAGDRIVDDISGIGLRVGRGFRAAIGTCAEGLVGMADSHEEARAARRAAEVLGARSGSVVSYQSVGLSALLTADPVEAVRFTEAELGELAAATDAAARLRATMRVYLEENLSPARSARRLSIHQNTVVYRVKRVEEILGRGVDERRLQLEVALRLSEGLDGLRAAASRGRTDHS
jgi:DNA-binding PucR family transcriptional regulator